MEVVEGGEKNDFLIVSGESKKKYEKIAKEGEFFATYNRFCNKFKIPKGEIVEAKYDDGFLTIKLETTKSKEEPEKRRKMIDITSS